jgi:hypothetical protein
MQYLDVELLLTWEIVFVENPPVTCICFKQNACIFYLKYFLYYFKIVLNLKKFNFNKLKNRRVKILMCIFIISTKYYNIAS